MTHPLLSSSKHAIIIPSKGLGDGLLMMISAFYLKKAGFNITVYHSALTELAPLFNYAQIAPLPDNLLSAIGHFKQPWVFLQHSNSDKDNSLIKNLRANEIDLSVFYGDYSKEKHAPLTLFDQLLPPDKTMAESINAAMIDLILSTDLKNCNGLTLPTSKQKNVPAHILIHPTSNDSNRNYPPGKFIKLAEKLLDKGMRVTFCMHQNERAHWLNKIPKGASLPKLPTLYATALLINTGSILVGNDSGLGHLASNLNLPTLIFSRSKQHITRWKPGFYPSIALTPPTWIPNFKSWRLREKYWHHFIPYKTPLRHVLQLAESSCA
ncbi:hypothetical protein COB21_01745 [Candidatus Aerophobetes bacterium]|uniref:ADP-heptose--LPS heptosyltransferase n=1 Tax=Aerophobetes bacterium TaxID=2030807 RepID=A0A2A4X616_UNCAE|nr:MAG: hypothetical protein COB21_01745 [Candidatus Aerophobetes bacterium]